MEKKESQKVRVEFEAMTLWKTATVVFAVLLIISIVTDGFSFNGDDNKVVVPTLGNNDQPVIADIGVDDDAILGSEDAPVTIVTCEDYQCPFCGRAFEQTFPLIKSNYIDTGKARYVVRDSPLPFHPEADEASLAAECAGDQDKYFEMHHKLFETQAVWSGDPKVVDTFKGYAQELGLDTAEFNTCMDSREFDDEIKKDAAECQAAGTSGTPTFYINGLQLVGAQPYSAFEAAIEQALQE